MAISQTFDRCCIALSIAKKDERKILWLYCDFFALVSLIYMFIIFPNIVVMLIEGKKFAIFVLLAKVADSRYLFLMILGSSKHILRPNSDFFIRFSPLSKSLIYDSRLLNLGVDEEEELDSLVLEIAAGLLRLRELRVSNWAYLRLCLSTSIKRF